MKEVYRVQVEWEKKCWGRVQHIFDEATAGMSRLVVEKGWECSKHRHKERANMFCVLNGVIEIVVYHGKELADSYLVTDGGILVVPSGVWHRFRVLERGDVIEVYWPDVEGGVCRLEDIERADEGGPVV